MRDSSLATTYRLTELTLGGTRSSGAAINASGQVTGSASTSDGDTHAFQPFVLLHFGVGDRS